MTKFEEKSDMTTQHFDQERAEAFAERMIGVLNSGSIALMTSIGHRTGLFDALAELSPSTSEEIASAAELNERYVREWLGAMVTGGIVEYDPEDRTYHLPAEHAAWLTRAATPNNIAVTAQFIPVLAQVEDGVVESFKNGGGVPYSAYPRFHEVMAEDSGQTVVAALIDHILPLMPGLTLLYTVSTMHCMTVSLAQGGEGLGTMWGEEKAKEMLEEAGFTKVEVEQLPHDFFNNYFTYSPKASARKKPMVEEVYEEMRKSAESNQVLRRATRDDCRRIAELMEIAGEGIPTYLWSLSAEDGQRPIDVGTERAACEDANLSYRNAVVAEQDGEVVAMVLAYRLPEVEEATNLEKLPELLRPLVELELLVPGTFYVNMLATLLGYRNLGLGSKLLDVADRLALEAGCEELSIEVFEQNEVAARLYERHGYQIVARRPVVPHPCYPYDGDVVLMTRKVISTGDGML